MKQYIRNSLEKALQRLPFKALINGSGVRVLNVFYHNAYVKNPPYFRGGYAVKTPEQFEADLDYLLRYLTPVSLDDLLAEKFDGLPSRSFFLSFDDGYRELAETIAPILQRKGVPATFFICSELIDNASWLFEDKIGLALNRLGRLASAKRETCEKDCLKPYGLSIKSLSTIRIPPKLLLDDLGDFLELDWDAELEKHRPYLTSDQIRGLINMGFSIGAHGLDHTVFESMHISEQLRQISESTAMISTRFGLPYRVFAFPYGEFGVSSELFSRVKDENIADALFGTRGLIDDELRPFVYQRLCCEDHDEQFKLYLKEHLASKLVRHWRGLDMVRRRE